MNCNTLILSFCLLFSISHSQALPIGNKMHDYSIPTEAKVLKNVKTQVPTTSIEKKLDVKNTKVSDPVTLTKKIKSNQDSKATKLEKTIFSIHDHSVFNELLSKYVGVNGFVNYKGLKNEESKLDSYLNSLTENYIKSSWSRNEKLAYWINAYNAYTLKLILKNYPLSSITDIDNGNPWDTKWINLGGKNLSLNNIENDIIRPTFNEPRIHFAVNCAAKSCPPLMNSAFVASKLDSQLESQTQKFLNNSNYNMITSSKVSVSKIFEWYKGDFGDLSTFINRYTKEDTKNAKIAFNEYNWALNGK